MKLFFNKKSREEELQLFEERFLDIISSKEYGEMISKQMSEVRQRAKKRNFKFNLIKNMNDLELLVRSLPGTHFRENNYNWITIREDVLDQIMEKIVKGEDISFI
jgi:hypothetical protein